MVKNNFFKQYQNKSSGLKRYSRYVQGGQTDYKTNRIGFWDRDVSKFSGNIEDIVINSLPLQYVGRPDLMAFDYYGRADLAWIILIYNNIVDLDEFAAGIQIVIPSRNYVYGTILSKSIPVSDVRRT